MFNYDLLKHNKIVDIKKYIFRDERPTMLAIKMYSFDYWSINLNCDSLIGLSECSGRSMANYQYRFRKSSISFRWMTILYSIILGKYKPMRRSYVRFFHSSSEDFSSTKSLREFTRSPQTQLLLTGVRQMLSSSNFPSSQ